MLHRDGSTVWVELTRSAVLDAAGEVKRWLVVLRDVTGQRREATEQRFEQRILELVATGTPLRTVLTGIADGIEQLIEGCHCSILLLDRSRGQLRHGAGPTLPAAYNSAIDGVAIGPDVGSCGRAAALNERVIVSDIANDPLWTDYRDLALGHHLRACWSTPIAGRDGQTVGTFAIYYRDPRQPTPMELRLVDRIGRLAGIAIQRHSDEDRLRRFERIVSVSPDFVAYIDDDFRYLAASRTYAETFGVDTDDMIGKMPSEVMGDMWTDEMRLCAERALAGEFVQKTYWITFPNGERSYVDAQYIPDRSASGAVTGYVVSVRDVTKSYQADEQLRRFEQTLAASEDLMSYLDRDLRYRYANDSFLRSFGKSRDEVIGRVGPLAVEPRVWARVRKDLERGLAGETFRVKDWITLPGGNEAFHDLLVMPDRGPDGEVHGISVVARDLTELMRAHESLRRYERIVSASADFLSFVDRQGRYRAVNQTYCDTFGMSEEQILGLTGEELFGTEQYQAHIWRESPAHLRRGNSAHLTLDSVAERPPLPGCPLPPVS